MGAWRTISGVDPGFHLPFSKGHGVSMGRQESSKEELVSAASTISVSNSVGRGVREGGSGDIVSQSKVGGVGGISTGMGTGE